MVKHSLNKLLVLLGFLALFWTYPVAAESYSDLYIKITDATTAVQNKDQAKAKELVAEIKTSKQKKITIPRGVKKLARLLILRVT